MVRLNRFRTAVLLLMGVVLSIVFSVFPNPLPIQAQANLTQLVRASDGSVSVRVPDKWSFQEGSNANYAALLFFGDSAAEMNAVSTYEIDGKPATYKGLGGLVGIISPALYQGSTPDQGAFNLVQVLVQSAAAQGLQILQQKPFAFADNAPGTLLLVQSQTVNAKGYLAVIRVGDQVVYATAHATPQNFTANDSLLLSILQSIHLPAEQALPAPVSTTVAPSQATMAATALATSAATVSSTTVASLPGISSAAGQTVSASDGSLSVVLPKDWQVSDLMSSQKVFVYGSTTAGRDTRLQAFQSGQPDTVQIHDSGGLLLLFAPADFKVTAPVDPLALLTSQLQQGNVKIVEPAKSFQVNNNPGAYVVIDAGNQRGFLAFIVFGDKIAYVTATSTPDGFAANRDSLLTILQSVRVPADKGGSGLPGLTGK